MNIEYLEYFHLFLGPSQPDEDDYGYVSQEASAFYNQLMSKYNNTSSQKPIFNDCRKKTIKDIASTKVKGKYIYFNILLL